MACSAHPRTVSLSGMGTDCRGAHFRRGHAGQWAWSLGRVTEQSVLDALERSERPSIPGDRRGSDPWVAYVPRPAAWAFQAAWRDLCQNFLRDLVVTQDRGPSFYQ